MKFKLKRIATFYIELIILAVILYFIYMGIAMTLYAMNLEPDLFCYTYVRPLLKLFIIIYYIFRNDIVKGQSILQKMFGITFKYNKKSQLRLKNLIDFFTFPISFVTIIIFNKTIGDLIIKTEAIDLSKTPGAKNNAAIYLIIAWFTIMPCITILAASFRIKSAEQEHGFRLNNTQTIKENIGFIKKFSFNDKLFWTGYDKEGEYLNAKIRNTNNEVFKVKVYLNEDEPRGYSYFVINGQKYAYETEKFSIDDYQESIDGFTDEIQVSEITNISEAKKSADEAYKLKFPDLKKKYRNYEVFYDKEHDCYKITYVSSINYDILDDCYSIIINSDGKVLAMFDA